MGYFEESIKSQLSMNDVAQRYGMQPNRAGFVTCPFHKEKTASLKIYKEPGKGFHCFGCGKGGSVIDFVMELYGIGVKEAVVRMNDDFGLNLPVGTRLSLREERKIAKAEIQRKREQKAHQDALRAAEDEYHEYLSLYCACDLIKNELAPLSYSDNYHPLYIKAISVIDYAWHNLKIAETRWDELVRTKHDSYTGLDSG